MKERALAPKWNFFKTGLYLVYQTSFRVCQLRCQRGACLVFLSVHLRINGWEHCILPPLFHTSNNLTLIHSFVKTCSLTFYSGFPISNQGLENTNTRIRKYCASLLRISIERYTTFYLLKSACDVQWPGFISTVIQGRPEGCFRGNFRSSGKGTWNSIQWHFSVLLASLNIDTRKLSQNEK